MDDEGVEQELALSAPRQSALCTVKVLIAEDDPLQRSALMDLLKPLRPEWVVVASVDSVEEVRRAVDSLLPDLCLIDIHLQGSTDPNWIKQLAADLAVIYVTGDPDFAVHAFESNAVDYVLKPVTPHRFKVALDRAARDPRVVGLTKALSALEPSRRHLSRITMSRGTDTIVAMRDDIAFLEADLKYTRVMTTRGDGLVRLGINELCARLPSDQFVRIHRAYVVNLRFVASVKRNEFGHLEVYLDGISEVLRVSKSYQHVFRPD